MALFVVLLSLDKIPLKLIQVYLSSCHRGFQFLCHKCLYHFTSDHSSIERFHHSLVVYYVEKTRFLKVMKV